MLFNKVFLLNFSTRETKSSGKQEKDLVKCAHSTMTTIHVLSSATSATLQVVSTVDVERLINQSAILAVTL